MELIVADSSPLILMARIGQLGLLPKIARRVIIPRAVWDEVAGARPDAPGSRAVLLAEWLEVRTVRTGLVPEFARLVGRGEAEALGLAMMEPDATLLLDDARARKLAARHALPRIGTLGLLARARQAGLISALRPLVDQLRAEGMWIEPRIVDAILSGVGE